MEKAEYVDRVAIRKKVCTGCTMLVDGVCCDADPCENLIAGFLEEPPADVVPAHRKENAHSVPLTLDELRQMDGEPVWVSVSNNWRESGVSEGWCIVRFHSKDDRVRVYVYDTRHGARFFAQQDYGESWLAYRQKPEEV